MRHFLNKNKGLTMVEVLVSAMLLTIISVISYSVFLSTSSLSSYSRDELEAETEIGGWMEQVRTGAAPNTTWQDLPTGGGWVEIDQGASIVQTFYKTPGHPDEWPLSSDRTSVSNLNAAYQINDESFNSTSAYDFRKVELRVTWDEKR